MNRFPAVADLIIMARASTIAQVGPWDSSLDPVRMMKLSNQGGLLTTVPRSERC